MGVTWTRDPNWPPPEGPNIDFPNFGRNDPASRFRFRSEKVDSCRLRDAALAMAFLDAGRWIGYDHRRHAGAVAFRGRLAMAAHSRLVDVARQA